MHSQQNIKKKKGGVFWFLILAPSREKKDPYCISLQQLHFILQQFPLQSPSSSCHRNVGSDIHHVKALWADWQKPERLQGNTSVEREVEASCHHSYHPWDFFPQPQYNPQKFLIVQETHSYRSYNGSSSYYNILMWSNGSYLLYPRPLFWGNTVPNKS